MNAASWAPDIDGLEGHVASYCEGRVVKRCACGREYSAAAWSALTYVGEQDDGVERLELRNCGECGSTVAILLGLSEVPR